MLRIRTQPFVNPRMSARNKPLPELLASTSAGPLAEALKDAELLPSGWGGISHPTSRIPHPPRQDGTDAAVKPHGSPRRHLQAPRRVRAAPPIPTGRGSHQ